MTHPFRPPGWTEESGKPYPGAEGVADAVERLEETRAVEAQAKIEKQRALARREGQRLAEAEEGAARKLSVTGAASIAPRRTKWLWAPGSEGHGRIPLGELTLIVGRGGVGKSTLLATMAAWLSVGDMQGEFYGEPKDVLYVANEDSLAKTVVPRLIGAGAELGRIHFVGIRHLGEEGRVLLPTDCALISAEAERLNAVAIMLDPLSSNLRVDNANDAKSVRLAVEAIRRMAERAGLAAIGLAHTRKAESKNLMDAIMGSSELGNVCRSVMGVMADPEEDEPVIVLSQEKSNLGRTDIPGYRYRIVDHSFMAEEYIVTSRVEFLGKTEQTVSDMLADGLTASGGTASVRECSEWLREYLTFHGDTSRPEVIAAGRKESYQEHTVKRAAKKLKLVTKRQGFPATSVWSLPSS